MNTTRDNDFDPRGLPDSIHPDANRAWRVSQGKIQRGRQGEEETRDAVLGKLVRVGTHHGTLDDGREYARLECELHTNAGVECVGVSLRHPDNHRPTLSSCTSLAEGILEVELGDLVQVSALQGKRQNRFGSYSTYVRVTKIDPRTMRPVATNRRARPNEYGEDYLNDLLAQLAKHSAWGPRASSENPRCTSPLAALAAACSAKGWPGPYEAKDAWLAMFRRDDPALETLEDLADVAVEAATSNIERATALPAFLKDAATQTTFDPFAD